MESNQDKYMAVSYKMYALEGDGEELVEQATRERPFEFITGRGVALDAFERNVAPLGKGDRFDFTLDVGEAYGEYDPERVVTLDRDDFKVNGHFDHDNVYVGAQIMLKNDDGMRFIGTVVDIDGKGVTVDLNDSLAGKDVRFVGQVIESRPATAEDIEALEGECHCGDCGHDHGDGHCHCHHGGE